MTPEALREEAERLVGLDERGRLVEAVALMLQSGENADAMLAQLEAIDREFLDAGDSESYSPIEGEAEEPLAEHLVP